MLTIKLLAFIPLILLAAACGPARQPEPVGNRDALQPQFGGIMQAASNPIPGGLYWYDLVAAGGGGHRTSLTPVFETLVTYVFEKPDFQALAAVGELAPSLAESWKQVDLKTYDFVLRKGVKWHDGEAFSVKDVTWSIQQWGQTIAPGDLRTLSKNMERVEAVGPDTLRIVLKQVDPGFLEALADYNPKILPAHIAENAGNPAGDALRELYNKTAVGTGPFKLRSFDKTRATELERFDGYWRGKPYLDGIRVIYRIDRSAQQAALIAGELDFVSLADRVQFDTVKASVPDVQKVSYIAPHNTGVEFNRLRKPWDDIRVRRALHLGLDRQVLHEAGSFGEGYIGAPLLVPSLTIAGWGMQQDEYLKLPGWRQPKAQDVAEAKRLLADAGIPPGYKVALKWRKGSTQPTVFAESFASQLKTIGLDVSAIGLEDATYIQQTDRDRDFDIRMESSVGGSLQAAESAYTKFHSKGAQNIGSIEDLEMDRLTEAAMVEADPKKRSELFTQMQRRIVDQVHYVSLPTISLFQALQPWLHGFSGSYSAQISIFNSHATWIESGKIAETRRKF